MQERSSWGQWYEQRGVVVQEMYTEGTHASRGGEAFAHTPPAPALSPQARRLRSRGPTEWRSSTYWYLSPYTPPPFPTYSHLCTSLASRAVRAASLGVPQGLLGEAVHVRVMEVRSACTQHWMREKGWGEGDSGGAGSMA